MNYFGDLQEKQITASQALFSGFAGVSYQASAHFSGNLGFTLGSVKAYDSENGPKWFYRNLSFQSSIMEIAGTVQYDLFNINQPDEDNITEMNPKKFTPFIFAGIGLVHYNPFTYDQSGKKVFLQPLGTEGQSSPYSLWSVSFPMGIGLKYALTSNIVVSGEFDFRKTLTDYMDDVSLHDYADSVQLLATRGQESASLSYRADEIPNTPYKEWGYRGNPDKKDGFYTCTIKIYYQLFARRPKFYYGY